MNERIKKLAEQSGLKVELWMTNPPKPFQILGSAEELEKFVELIIKDCLELADLFEIDVNRTGIVSAIKTHFGIEE